MTRSRSNRLGSLLVQSVQADGEAFGELFDLTIADTFKLASLTSKEFADELVEHVYRRAWAQRTDFGTSGLSPRAWVLSFVGSSAHAVREAHASPA